MKLNRTREEWESYRALHSKQDCAALYHHAVADLLALSAEVDRLTAQLAEREAECFKLAAGVCEYRSGDDHGNPLCLMVRKPIPPNMYPIVSRFHAAEGEG